MTPKCANSSLPALTELCAELKNFENWYLLGLQLNLSTDTLSFIEKAHNAGDKQCIEMIKYWINNSKDTTWETIHEALRNISESVIAAKISCKYNIQPSTIIEEKSPALSSDTHEVLKQRQIMSREQRRIICYFDTLMNRIADTIETIVSQEKLLGFLHVHCHPLSPEMPYIDNHILQSTSSVSGILNSLVPDYINYMNTGFLELIILRFECEEAKRLLQQYHDRYPLNRLLRDMPYPVQDARLDLTRCSKLRVKCTDNFASATTANVKMIQTSIEEATGIYHWFVTPAQHSEESHSFTFLTPENVSVVFYELCYEDLFCLAGTGVMELQIGDFVISDIQKFYLQRSAGVSVPMEIGAVHLGFDSYMAEQFTTKEKGRLRHLLETVPRSRMEEVASGLYLQELATHMRDWKELAPHLGISENSAEDLAHYHPDIGEQRYMALCYWKQINPSTATYINLIACLLAHAPFDLAEAALKMLSPGRNK